MSTTDDGAGDAKTPENYDESVSTDSSHDSAPLTLDDVLNASTVDAAQVSRDMSTTADTDDGRAETAHDDNLNAEHAANETADETAGRAAHEAPRGREDAPTGDEMGNNMGNNENNDVIREEQGADAAGQVSPAEQTEQNTRHSGGVVYAFCDGHAKWFNSKQLAAMYYAGDKRFWVP